MALQWMALLGFIAVCTVAAFSASYARPGAWYEALDKPPWTPANWVFPVVWTILYAMIAVSGWLVWLEAGFAALPMAVFVLQLALNAAWSLIFFKMRRIDWALWEAGALWLSIALNIAVFATIRWEAALLLVPYQIWVTIAFALNLSIYRRNPDAVTA